MKIDFSQTLRELDGSIAAELTYEDPRPGDAENAPRVVKGKRVLTLGIACARALSMGLRTDNGLKAEEAIRRMKLAFRLYDARVGEISVDDAALIRDRAGQGLGILLAGQIGEMLDPKDPEPAKD